MHNRICPVKLEMNLRKKAFVFDRSGENRKCKPATEGRDEKKVDGNFFLKRHESETKKKKVCACVGVLLGTHWAMKGGFWSYWHPFMLDICDIVEGTDSPIFPVGVLQIFCFVGRDLELHSLVNIDSISESPRVNIYITKRISDVWISLSSSLGEIHQHRYHGNTNHVDG